MNIYKTVMRFYGQVNRILKKNDFSEKSIEIVADKVEKFADNLERKLSKYSWFEKTKDDDTTKLSLTVETSGDAIGDDTLADSMLNATVVDRGNVSFALASASSLAVADGGETYVTTNSFAAVEGADFALTKTVNKTGKNFQLSTEYLFAVDFEFIKDLNVVMRKEKNIVTQKAEKIGTGNVALVEFDASSKGQDTYVDVVADALAIEDTLSSTYVGADLFIA
jgi:hypothetical protein